MKKTAKIESGGIERRTGIAVWRQIADRIREGIAAEELQNDGKLPPEIDLAARFGVNRHTVRAAIAALIAEDVLRAEQGRGTFVVSRRRLSYPITRRTRFSAGLDGQAEHVEGKLMETVMECASPDIAEALKLRDDRMAVRLETLNLVDGVPISRATSWFDASRFPEIPEHYRKTGSITASLSRSGIDDYLRRSTVIEARHASPSDLQDLKLSPGAIILVTKALNVDCDGRPIQYSITNFAADRMEMRVENEDPTASG